LTRVAVVGHVEWVDFLALDRLPRQGEVLRAEQSFTRAAGGGGVAAVVLAELGAEVEFFCALGRDRNGEAAEAQLRKRGVEVHVAWRPSPTRRAVTLLEPAGERTIVTIGERLQPIGADPLPWERLQEADGAYFTAGDRGALESARGARSLVVTPRGGPALTGDGPQIDVVVFSVHDRHEAAQAAQIADQAKLFVATAGARGGRWWGESAGSWEALEPLAPPRDAYGCGDSFAAGLTLGLAQGRALSDAVHLGAECGARTLTRPGAP
jgi:ribokinase